MTTQMKGLFNTRWLRLIPYRNFTKTNMDLDSVTQNTTFQIINKLFVRGGPFYTRGGGGGFVKFRKKLSGFHLLQNKLSGFRVVRKKLSEPRRATNFVA